MGSNEPSKTTQTQTISVQAKGQNTFPIVLMAPPPPPPAPPPPKLASLQLRGFGRDAEVYLDDKSVGTMGLRGVFSSIPLGVHEISVVDKYKETYKMPTSFASGELVKLTKKDFPPQFPLSRHRIPLRTRGGARFLAAGRQIGQH